MHRFLFPIVLLYFNLIVNAQNFTYLNSSGKKIPNEENAFTRLEIKPVNDSIFFVYKAENIDGKWSKIKFQNSVLKKSEQVFHMFENENLKGDYDVLEILETLTLGFRIKQSNKNNEIQFTGDAIQLFPTILHGKCTYYDVSAMPMVEKVFNNGLKIGETLLFHPVDSNLIITKIPEFPGGSRGFYIEITKNIKYPGFNHHKIINEDVYIKFLINEDGKMSQIGAGSNSIKSYTKECIRVISLVNKLWEPAVSNGKKIPVWHYAKITFGGSFILQ